MVLDNGKSVVGLTSVKASAVGLILIRYYDSEGLADIS